MKSMTLIFVIILTFFACLGAAFAGTCTYKVGIILPLTGEKAEFGEIERRSFEMAFTEINNAGGVNGCQIERIYEDDTARADVAAYCLKKLVEKDKVCVLTGGFGSTEMLAISEAIEKYGVPFLITSAASPKITQQGFKSIFRINPIATEYTTGLVSFLQNVVKPKTAVVIYENSGFGSVGAKDFKDICDKNNIQLLLSEKYQNGISDFRHILAKVKTANPELVYMVSYLADATAIINQAAELQIHPNLFVGNGAGFAMPDFQKICGKNANLVYTATLWAPSLPYPNAQAYFDAYKKLYGSETEYHGAEAYAAAYVITDAITRAKLADPNAIRSALTATNIQTAFGPVKFQAYDNMTNQNKVPTYLAQWINGTLELVWPEATATKKYIYPTNVQNKQNSGKH